MALPISRNLGSLRQELRDRLGFAALGSSAGINTAILDSFLRQAQEQLYWEYVPRIHIGTDEIVTQDGQLKYDWPDNCNPDRLLIVTARDTTAATPSRWPLIEGIEYFHDDFVTPKSQPSRYERRDQIEIWPSPDSNKYRIDLEYVKRLNAFSVDTDKATLDSDLILILALANAKSHYRHEDAAVYGSQFTRMLEKIKGGTHGSKRFIRGSGKYKNQYNHYFDHHMKHYHLDDV